MKIEIMIYVYIAICVSMIAFNIIYVFILKRREKALYKNSENFEMLICRQIDKIENGNHISDEHKAYLRKILDKTDGITAFDKALEKLYRNQPEIIQKYLVETFSVFEFLTRRYMSKNTIKIAYFPYILYKYDILNHYESERLKDELLELMRSVNVYCRENTIKAIYSMQNPDMAVTALKILDKNLTFHHPKLICDGLLTYKGDKNLLKDKFFENFDELSVQMKVNILNYFRFGNVRCDKQMLEILKDKKQDKEMHFCAIRYFEKFPSDDAAKTLHNMAENLEGRAWEYQAIATSALKSYPGDVTFRILVKNLTNSNWHVRHNSAVSCEKLGYSYYDLIGIFDGEDRFAREMMRYYLDKRTAEEQAVKL